MLTKEQLTEKIKQRHKRKLEQIQHVTVDGLVSECESKQNASENAYINPFVNRYIKKTRKTANIVVTVMNIGDKAREKGYIHSIAIAQGFDIAGIALSALEFIRIPAIYLTAYLLNEKVPFSLSKGLRWLYASVLLGLAITSLVFPPAGFIIGFFVASAAVALSIVLIARAYLNRRQALQQLSHIEQEIKAMDARIDLLKQEAQKLADELDKTTDPNEIDTLINKIGTFDEQYDQVKLRIEELLAEKRRAQKIIEHYNDNNFFKKTETLLLASLTLIGISVALVFPPAGLGIIATSALISLVLVTYRTTKSIVAYYKSRKSIAAENVEATGDSTKNALMKMDYELKSAKDRSSEASLDKEDNPMQHGHPLAARNIPHNDEDDAHKAKFNPQIKN